MCCSSDRMCPKLPFGTCWILNLGNAVLAGFSWWLQLCSSREDFRFSAIIASRNPSLNKLLMCDLFAIAEYFCVFSRHPMAVGTVCNYRISNGRYYLVIAKAVDALRTSSWYKMCVNSTASNLCEHYLTRKKAFKQPLNVIKIAKKTRNAW